MTASERIRLAEEWDDDTHIGVLGHAQRMADQLRSDEDEIARLQTLFHQRTNQVRELRAKLAEAEVGHRRYEYMRTLKPVDFIRLWTVNIEGIHRFDDLVDAAIDRAMQRSDSNE